MSNEIVYVHKDKLTDLADAVRERFGVTGTKTLDELTEIVKPHLPSEYQQVDYVASDGNPYIDTGVDAADSYELTFLANSISNDKSPFGSRRSTNTKRLGVLYYNGMYVWQNGNINTEIPNFVINTKYTVKAGAIFGNKIIVNDSELASNVATTSDCRIFLFGFGENGNYYNGGYGRPTLNGRVYMCRIYSNGECVRDFIPCYRKSDNVIGMYDIINETFYTNAGSGSFTCYPSPT